MSVLFKRKSGPDWVKRNKRRNRNKEIMYGSLRGNKMELRTAVWSLYYRALYCVGACQELNVLVPNIYTPNRGANNTLRHLPAHRRHIKCKRNLSNDRGTVKRIPTPSFQPHKRSILPALTNLALSALKGDIT